jgi:hypothetical protein
MTDLLEDPPPLDGERPSIAVPVRAVLAACLVGAAAIHLAMVPSHADEWLPEGIAFALTGWLQLALAAVIVFRPSRAALQVTLVANVAFIGAWLWTRTAGAPFGPEAGAVHEAAFVDITCVALEAIAVLTSATALLRPRLGARLARPATVALAAIPVGILVVATMAIASPSASGHAHGGGASGEAHEQSHDGASGGHADDAPGGSAAGAGDHGHGAMPADGEPVDDKGLALLENGEMAHQWGPDVPLEAEDRSALAHQLALTRLIADRFPTLGDAKAAGSRPAGGFGPGMGIHMTTPSSGMPEVPPRDPAVPHVDGTLTDEELLRPANLLYDGTRDDAPIAGFMYYSPAMEEPEGFVGPNDHWHTHGSLCVKIDDGVKVLHPAEKTAASCRSVDGIFVEKTNSMVHVWTVPGYESNRGVFSDINPAIACPDGTYYIVPEAQNETYKVNKCRSNPE